MIAPGAAPLVVLGVAFATANSPPTTVANFLTRHTGVFAIGLGVFVAAALAFALRPPPTCPARIEPARLIRAPGTLVR